MIRLIRSILQILPWILLLAMLSWMVVEEKFFGDDPTVREEIYLSSVLSKVEQMGKLELVKYNFQEVTELKQVADYIDLKLFKYKPVPDSKAVLISTGMAVGCINLTQINRKSIREKNDTLYVRLPQPELCYFKIDLEQSRIYDLQIDYMNKEDKAKFMERLYQEAETKIRSSALEMGILEQTKENAKTILTPIFEGLSDKAVIFTFDIPTEKILRK
ncbi:DUF4230 domain-containing protein [Reichenbachiella agarivorans]|uniref:DUF4230 domain-containing protein n=1 Tax=Reichenbachiella agarivorans TaxID=2979464 RepID=A0ABY6CMN9_9BACT|nr:DUF4230 domain-containing protein [Reichenbachiella agarivorans]UXP31776.1 DUF4230 domain-containing protein [Reichenbachiella agarivorans]